MDVMTLAGNLVRVIDERGLESSHAEDLTAFEGIGEAKATVVLAAIEFARRRIKPEGSKIEYAGGCPPSDSTFCRPQARAFPVRHHQWGQRSSQCAGRVHWVN